MQEIREVSPPREIPLDHIGSSHPHCLLSTFVKLQEPLKILIPIWLCRFTEWIDVSASLLSLLRLEPSKRERKGEGFEGEVICIPFAFEDHANLLYMIHIP